MKRLTRLALCLVLIFCLETTTPVFASYTLRDVNIPKTITNNALELLERAEENQEPFNEELIHMVNTMLAYLEERTGEAPGQNYYISDIYYLNGDKSCNSFGRINYDNGNGIYENRWPDIVAIFAVQTTTEAGMDVVTLDDVRAGQIRETFWAMTDINYYEKTVRENDQPVIILVIEVSQPTARTYAASQDWTSHQLELLDQMLSGEVRPLMLALLGIEMYQGLSADELQIIYNNLPDSELGSEVVRQALTWLGTPYSQERAGTDGYTDCSYLTRWCYAQVGISLPRTAAEQARYCYDNNLTISKSDLQPGDLVFWSYSTNGRFMNVGHVGIYAGDGKVIDATYSKLQVVYRDLFDSAYQVMYGRPLN